LRLVGVLNTSERQESRRGVGGVPGRRHCPRYLGLDGVVVVSDGVTMT